MLILLLVGCKKADNKEIKEIDKDVFNFVVYKIMPQFINERYDINGVFYGELPDSLVKKSLKGVFSENEIEYIASQYTMSRAKNLEPYFREGSYSKKMGYVYYDTDSISYHFVLSPPLYNKERDTCVMYCTAMPINFNGKSAKDGFYFLISVNGDTLKYLNVIKNASTTFVPQDDWKDTHEFSLIPILD